MQPGHDKTFLRPPLDESPTRLFCFPYSGLGASMFNGWPRRITDQGSNIEVCLLQPPGRENRTREPHYGTYDELAEQLVVSLDPYLDRPYGFFGHCGGALAAFATARLILRTRLSDPACLFISSQVAPHQGPYGRYLSMSDQQLSAELQGLTRAMGVEPHPEILAMNVRVMRADIGANQQYHLAEPVVLNSDVLSIGWRDDVEIRPEQMSGWADYAGPERFRHVVLPGAHHAFLAAPESLRSEVTYGFAQARTNPTR